MQVSNPAAAKIESFENRRHEVAVELSRTMLTAFREIKGRPDAVAVKAMKQAAERISAPKLLNQLPLLFASQLKNMLDCVLALKVLGCVVGEGFGC